MRGEGHIFVFFVSEKKVKIQLYFFFFCEKLCFENLIRQKKSREVVVASLFRRKVILSGRRRRRRTSEPANKISSHLDSDINRRSSIYTIRVDDDFHLVCH
jgi:hypothetical protein